MTSACARPTASDDARFWRGIERTVSEQRIPFSGSLALTNRCNLACLHCYAREGGDGAGELDTRRWLEILDEIQEAGCLYVLLTGGEPLLRRDFAEIYGHAKRSGFLVTLFTNGTLIDEPVIDLFRSLPPYRVEVSLYGAEAAIHDRITGVPGSFDRALSGIETLLKEGFAVSLKSVLMTANEKEFPAIEGLARGLGARFRFDAGIFPAWSGDNGPVALRVAPERAVELEMADPARRREWRDFLAAFRGTAENDGLYNCGSGINTFHVEPDGVLHPCLMVRSVRHSLAAGSFREGWENVLRGFRDAAPGAAMPCTGCEKKLLCGYCPGFFALEKGSESIPSEYLCAIGNQRYEVLNSLAAEE